MDQTDIDALVFLNELLNTPTQIVFYFHYDPLTGKVIHIRNYLESNDEYPYLEISQNDYDTTVSINDYQIIDNDGKKKLVKNINSIDNLLKIDDQIHQILKYPADPNKKQYNYQFDMLIEQDDIKKEFRIRLSGEVKDQYHQSSTSNRHVVCYVTAENDPNILYRKLDIPLVNLLKYEYYTLPYNDYDGTPCNIFAFRFFQNYLHLVIK